MFDSARTPHHHRISCRTSTAGKRPMIGLPILATLVKRVGELGIGSEVAKKNSCPAHFYGALGKRRGTTLFRRSPKVCRYVSNQSKMTRIKSGWCTFFSQLVNNSRTKPKIFGVKGEPFPLQCGTVLG